MPEIVSTARYAWRRGIDYRAHPELYRVGRGEQGVLTCEPYKSEILPHWRFRTPPIAARSARKILELFEDYLKNDDFVGADMARKFLQMGYRRSRRYANYKGGRKYSRGRTKPLARGTGDPQKAEAAKIFHAAWKTAESHGGYRLQRRTWATRHARRRSSRAR